MLEAIRTAFRRTVGFLPGELAVMPLSRWNESVFRYYFCHFLSEAHRDITQLVECDRIDLVLRQPPLVAFLEFKFYIHRCRVDPYDGVSRGFKGGPGRQNLTEFQTCIDQLDKRPSSPNLSKYVVLIYADPTNQNHPNHRYSDYYDAYRHPGSSVTLKLVESCGPIETPEATVRAKLYAIEQHQGVAPT
jgi:hypothetical protein